LLLRRRPLIGGVGRHQHGGLHVFRAPALARRLPQQRDAASGMGAVDAPKSDGGKLFAGCYALYAGLVFLISVGVVLVPMMHRLLHRFHWNQKG
jgi:hypothetical protein